MSEALYHLLRSAILLVLGLYLLGSQVQGQTVADTWSDQETRLANQYLSLLVAEPEYGRVLELLWNLYDKHDATALLLDNVSLQAKTNRHPSVLMVLGHLHRKKGDLKQASVLYEEVIKQKPAHLQALRARADVAQELGDAEAAVKYITLVLEAMSESDPARIRTLMHLGSLKLGTDKNEEAVRIWEKAAALKPGDFDLTRQVAESILRAGFPDRAAAFYEKLTEQGEPQKRLDALYDLARIHEYAGQFEKAEAALLSGLGLLDFRDGRYADFLRRRVRLHERFGRLESLRADLEKAAQKLPVTESALRDLERFYEITVESEGRLRVLRDLAKAFLQVEDYRWSLVRELLDHEGAAEAATLLDERLKGDASDQPALVFLRCEADLRLGNPAAATKRITQLLADQANALDVEKQALQFAQQRALDAVVETILKARVERDSSKAESVFELAAFYRARKDMAAADALLRRFTDQASSDEEKKRRLNDAATFLASGSDLDSAIVLARQALARPGAGREETLRLADLLAEHGDQEEAMSLLEKAWSLSESDEDGVDVDERLYSLLMGDEKKQQRRVRGSGGEFQMPDAFTGKGFASADAEPEKALVPEAVLKKVLQLFALPDSAEPAEKPVVVSSDWARQRSARELFRAAWWAQRTELYDLVYQAFRALQVDPLTGADRELSLEAEKLLLDLALVDKNLALAMRVLRRLLARDEPNQIRYTLRLGELLMEDEQNASIASSIGLSAERTGWRLTESVPLPVQTATAFLEQAFRRWPDSDQLLQALTQCYTIQRRPEEALKLWKNAIARASGTSAISLMERYAEMLLRQLKIPEYVEAQFRIVEVETEVKKRREAYKRFLDRLMWSEQGAELSDELAKTRLKLVRDALELRVKRFPFDGFYHEALAQVHEREGDAPKAFAEMKQAYYTAPDTPFSLDQLRDAALRVEDAKSAIYFQKQIAAQAGPKELAAESRRLVEMLEQSFQIAEADRVRRRLESRFSQDAAALEDLAEHYRTTGQDEAERRVYEQVAKVRPWDARSQLRLALKALHLMDLGSAEKYLREIGTRTQSQALSVTAANPERLPLPLADDRKAGSLPAPASEVNAALDMVPALKTPEIKALRTFLSLPRAEFSELPESVPLVRLRAIEELARLYRSSGAEKQAAWVRECADPAGWVKSPVERLWAYYYAGVGEAFRTELRRVMGAASTLEAQFSFLWLTLRSGGIAEGMRWSEQTGVDADVLETRQRLLLAVAAMLAELEGFQFERGELTLLGTIRSVSVVDILRRLQDKQRYPEALELGESLRLHNPLLAEGFTYSLARIAESAERWDLARHYLGLVVRAPVRPEAYSGTYDPYLFSLSAANRLAVDAQERDENLRAAWKRLQATPSSAMTSLRRSAVTGLAGSPDKAAAEMQSFITRDLISARQMGEIRGMLTPQGSPRYEEPMHLRSLWEETREIQARFVQEGMGQVVHQVNEGLASEWGSVALSSRSGLEFGEWRLGHLLRRLREVDYLTRLRLIREHLASVDMRLEVSVDTLSELGGRLETMGMAREAIAVYAQLPARAPANPEYAQWLIRAAEVARDTQTGLKFTLQLLNAEPPMKPPQPGDEVLREKHAHFLAQEYDVAELHRLGYRTQITRVLQGRIPHEVPYLRELALLHEKLGQETLALAAWQRLHEAYAVNEHKGITPEPESCVHLSRLLISQKQKDKALVALRLVPLTEKAGQFGQEALKLRATLLGESQGWEEFRELMSAAITLEQMDALAHLAQILSKAGRRPEALNFLTQAERSIKEDTGRFRLRLEQLKLLSQEPAWTPERGRSQISALLRVRCRDRETLKQLMIWLSEQASGENADAWMTLLRGEVRRGSDRALAALALSAFAQKAPDSLGAEIAQGWQAAREQDRLCMELAAETLLSQQRPRWAWTACLALQDRPTLRLEGRKLPMMLKVAHALDDRAMVQDLFSEVVRMPFPGGTQTVAWAEAFAQCGEETMAREVFQVALEHLESTQTTNAEISVAWVRYLLQQRQFDEAESYLMHHLWHLTDTAAELIFELYAAWGRLADIRAELRKFHLPGGIEKEVLFRSAKALGLPPPVKTPSAP